MFSICWRIFAQAVVEQNVISVAKAVVIWLKSTILVNRAITFRLDDLRNYVLFALDVGELNRLSVIQIALTLTVAVSSIYVSPFDCHVH